MTKRGLRILMINHHRRSKVNCVNRSLAMAKYLVRQGHSITLLTTADYRKAGIVESRENGVRIVEIPDLLWGCLRSGWDSWSALNRLSYLLRNKTDFDLIHLFESRPAVIHPVQLYRSKRPLPLIIDWVDWIGRGGLLEVLRPCWYRFLFGGMETYYEEHFRANADGLTVICTALRERAQSLGVAQDSILQIPVGVDFDIYPVEPDKAICRSEVGITKEIKILTFAGVDADFDLPIVLGALERVVKKHPETRMMLTGRSNPGKLRLAAKYGVADHIISTGYIPFERFPTYLGCADIFLLPFPNKTYNLGRWPSKICDYMATGRPIISNPTGDVERLFKRHEIGMLAEENVEDFANKIIFLIEHPDIADRMGHLARWVAENEYNWQKLIKSLEDFYFKILKKNARA